MIIKSILVVVVTFGLTICFAAEVATPTKKIVSAAPPTVPKLKSGEYSLSLDDKYTVFKTKKADGLELDLSCFKKNAKKPDCMALTFAKIKTENVVIPHPSMNNKAAFLCTQIKGVSLIAKDSKNNEIDFCRFADNSMVSSWSMYLKQHPARVVK